MSPFAKIHADETGGQILVKIDLDPEGRRPEVRVFYSPHDRGLCSMVRTFPANETGWRAARAHFDGLDEAAARAVAANIATDAGRRAG